MGILNKLLYPYSTEYNPDIKKYEFEPYKLT